MKKHELIRERHSALHAALLDQFGKVRRIADREFVELLDVERCKLYEWRARIAGIGQVKAGKSSFLSAFIDRPGFLPSEVNPWTAVITNLRFGHPDDPEEGGVFHFFAEDDWLRIIEGESKTRELAQDLLPGFDSETLRQQVETMRARAKQRLGNFYSVLLGGSHSYDRITRDMLDRYVCAGGEFTKTTDRTGRYSDITERADIYLPKGRWAVPAVVTDTPGVNDPFLVRDEFTCRSLLNSDIFVLILSVHQALTEVDIALVRMITEQPDKHILVIINRVDELDRIAETAPKVREDVSKRISTLIPGRDVDVILVSAAWAELVTGEQIDHDLVAKIANNADVIRYLQDCHGLALDDPAEVLWQASGIARVSQAIDTAITDKVGHRILQEQSQVLSSLVTSIRSHLETARRQAKDMKAETDQEGSISTAAQREMGRQAEEADHLADELSEIFDRTKQSRDELVDVSWRSARRELDLTVIDFIERQTADLVQVISGHQSESQFELETRELRNKLEEQARESYQVARQNLDIFLDKAVDEIQQTTARLFVDHAFDAGLNALPNASVMPIAAETSKTLTLDLVTSRGWQFWANSRLSEDEALRALKEIIRAEFYSVVENLTDIVHEALVQRAFEALRRVESMTFAMIDAARQRSREFSPIASGSDPKNITKKIDETILEIDEKLSVLAEVEDTLTNESYSGHVLTEDSA